MAALGGRDVAWADVAVRGATGGGSGEEQERKRRELLLSSSRSAFVLLALPRTPEDMRKWLIKGSEWEQDEEEDEARANGGEERKRERKNFLIDSKERRERDTTETEESAETKRRARAKESKREESKREEALGKIFAEEALPKTLCARARQLGVRLCFVDATPYAEDIVRIPNRERKIGKSQLQAL